MARTSDRGRVDIGGDYYYGRLLCKAKHIAAVQRRPVLLARLSDKPWEHLTRFVLSGVDTFVCEAREPKSGLRVRWERRVAGRYLGEGSAMAEVVAGMRLAPARLRRRFATFLAERRAAVLSDIGHARQDIVDGERAIGEYGSLIEEFRGPTASGRARREGSSNSAASAEKATEDAESRGGRAARGRDAS